MATRQNKTKSSDILNWLNKPINKFISISTVISAIFISGYKVGDFKKDLEQQFILIKKQQECNEAVQNEKEKCLEYKREIENKQIENLTKTVEELKKIKGGAYEK